MCRTAVRRLFVQDRFGANRISLLAIYGLLGTPHPLSKIALSRPHASASRIPVRIRKGDPVTLFSGRAFAKSPISTTWSHVLCSSSTIPSSTYAPLAIGARSVPARRFRLGISAPNQSSVQCAIPSPGIGFCFANTTPTKGCCFAEAIEDSDDTMVYRE